MGPYNPFKQIRYAHILGKYARIWWVSWKSSNSQAGPGLQEAASGSRKGQISSGILRVGLMEGGILGFVIQKNPTDPCFLEGLIAYNPFVFKFAIWVW